MALELDSSNSNSFYNKGWSFYNLKKYQNAIDCYNKAIELNPKDIISLINKAVSLDDMGKYEDAIECYNQVIKLNPNNQIAFNNKGIESSNESSFKYFFHKLKSFNLIKVSAQIV